MRKSIIPVIVIILFSNLAYADTVIMKNKTKIKGLVVDEYVDRVALSTIEGEKYILRKEIDTIEYDTPEQNFMQPLNNNYRCYNHYQSDWIHKESSVLKCFN